MFWKKKKPKLIDDDILDLKETVWHLQIIASSLHETTDQLRDNVELLRDMNRASPNYVINRERINLTWNE